MRRLLPNASQSDIDLADAYSLPDADHLRALFVTSADGSATTGGTSGGLGNDSDRAVLIACRRLCDAVLVGAGTVRSEGYGPIKFSDSVRADRRAVGLAPDPTLVILSRQADFDPTSPIFVESLVPPIIVTTEASAKRLRLDLGVLAELVTAGSDDVDLTTAMEQLRERGLHHVLCEGGPSLLGQLIGADLVDELCLTISPALAGGDGHRIVGGLAPLDPPKSIRLSNLFTDDEGFLFARYSLI